MPLCKRDGCRNEAQKYGKRLCPEHEADRKKRAAAYFAKPKCTYCGTQHTMHTDECGNPQCPTCKNRQEEETRAAEMKSYVRHTLRECETVYDLALWIEHNILDAVND